LQAKFIGEGIMNTAYVGEIVAKRNGQLRPSFYAFAFSAYSQTRYEFREGNYGKAVKMLQEYERVHSGDSFYWTYRRYLAEDEIQYRPSAVKLAA
jgi:hypothetical protein